MKGMDASRVVMRNEQATIAESRAGSQPAPLRFWRRPGNWLRVLLVIFGAAVLEFCHWTIRHDDAARELFSIGLTDSEIESLTRNLAGAIAAALLVWIVCGAWRARRRGESPEAGLRAIALCFTPGLIAAIGATTNILAFHKDLARVFEAFALGGLLAALWSAFDLWPIRAAVPEPHPPRRYARFLAGAILVYAALFTWLAIARYQTFHAALNDLGMYTQQFWGNLHGRWFLLSGYGLARDTMLGEHFMPLILILTPFYALWQDPRTILVLQTAAVALAVVPLFAIARRYGFDRRVALLFAGSFLLHPQVQVGTLYDFHPDAFVPLFALGAFWALLALDERLARRTDPHAVARPFPRRLVLLYALCVFLWLTYKEDALFGVAMLGLYAMVFRRRPMLGAATALVGIAYGALAIGWIIPHFRGETYGHIGRYYYLLEPFGWTPDDGSFFLSFIKISLAHPLHMAGQLLNEPRVQGLLILFGPVLFLPFLGPKELLIAAPAIALNLLSSNPPQHEFALHYPFAMLPFVYVSALVGLRNHSQWIARRRERAATDAPPDARPRLAPAFAPAAAALLIALVLCLSFGETPLSRAFAPETVWRTAHHRLADEFLKQTPPDASLTAQAGLAAHATHRLEIFEFPHVERNPEYVLLDYAGIKWPLSEEAYPAKVREFLQEGRYGVVRAEDGLVLLRRGHATEKNTGALAMLEGNQAEE